MNQKLTVIVVLAVAFSSCATAKPVALSQSGLGGRGACRTEIETNGVEGIVRHVDGEPARELWDTDGDGVVDYEMRFTSDAKGLISGVERAMPDGTVVERLAREWNGGKLVAETGDVLDAKGHPVADGTVDWRRTLTWEGERLVEETIDQRDANMLPGSDGVPEFRIAWKHDGDGRSVEGTRFRGDRAVAVTTNVWSDGQLVEERTDFGPDGTIDVVRRNAHDAKGRLVSSESTSAQGTRVIRHAYCD